MYRTFPSVWLARQTLLLPGNLRSFCISIQLLTTVDSLIFVRYQLFKDFMDIRLNHEFKSSTSYTFSKGFFTDFAKSMKSSIHENTCTSFLQSPKNDIHKIKWTHIPVILISLYMPYTESAYDTSWYRNNQLYLNAYII